MADDVKGTLEVDEDVADPKDPKKTKKVEVTFLYVELKPKNDRGGGPRGIKIHRKGSEKGSQQYKLDPNPHDSCLICVARVMGRAAGYLLTVNSIAH